MIASKISLDIIFSVIPVAAIGAIAFTLILYLSPSFANVLVKPQRPAFAVE